MKKFVLLSILFLSSIISYSQINVSFSFTDEKFRCNGYWSAAPIYQYRDLGSLFSPNYYIKYYPEFGFARLDVSHNDGIPTNVVFVNDSGFVRRSPIDSLLISQNNIIGLNSKFLDYYTKLQSDALYKPIGYVPAWTDITSKPSFATVATSGSYLDLTNKPIIPSSQVNSDWNSGSGISQILNKPSLATVAISGSYNDLTSKPTIPTNTNQLTNGAGFLTAEVDGSITNEIELPSQTSNSGKVLSTNGTSPSWITSPLSSDSIIVYNQNGTPVKKKIKQFSGKVTPSTSNGYSIDLSALGYTTLLSYTITTILNTSTPNLVPNVSVKTDSNTAIVINITQGNQAVVSVLGINVLSGAPLVFADVTGMTLAVTVIGY